MVPVEPISLSVGVATLFSTCVECFKYFKAGQAQHADYELLELEFDLIKSRMLIWGNAIGIGNVTEGAATTEDDTSEPMSLLARSLNAVKSLLEDYKTLQNKYGLKEVTETTRSTASVRDLPSFQPLNLFRTSRLYIRLRGRRPNATSTNLASRTFWAIIDKEKFEDLVAHLKKLVDGLESVYPIPVAARDQTFQSSVATIEFSKLRIVDAACEVVYPELEWASIARTVKDASDLGTLDLRNVAEWRTDTRPIATTSSPSLEFIDPFGYLRTPVSLVLTAPCRLVSEDRSCESSLGRLFSFENLDQSDDPSHLANEAQPWDLASRLLRNLTFESSRDVADGDRLLELKRNADGEGKTFAFPKEKVYIYCAPCVCQIYTAFRICEGATGPAEALFQLSVCIDDRLPATCCEISSGAARLAVVVEQIRSREMDLHPRNQGSLKYIDRDWIDQRLYEQEDEIFQISSVGGAKSLSFIFNRLRLEDLAAVIILGERDHLVPMLQYSPFQQSERILRENQFFHVEKKRLDDEWRWSLKYLGSFTPKRSLSAQTTKLGSIHPQGQHYLHETSMTAAASSSRNREVSRSANTSVKRRRIHQMID